MFNSSQPSLQDFLAIYKSAIRGLGDPYADVRDGSVYEQPGGVAAIIWSREAQRDEDLFRAIYFNTADGSQLTDIVQARDGITRIMDSAGTGTATFARPNSFAGGGTIWAGTRIIVTPTDGSSDAIHYEVSQDTFVGFQTVIQVPIRATFNGLGAAVYVDNVQGNQRVRLDDSLWDQDWSVTHLVCGDGTVFEPARDFRTRVRQARLDRRVGYVKSITTACKEIGASQIALFASDYGGDANDVGLNVCYVGDSGYNSTPALVNATKLALESVRVLGDNIQVFPMNSAALTVTATVVLKDAPHLSNQARLGERIANKIIQYLGQGFVYSKDEIAGAIFKASAEVQDATILAPSVDIGILTTINGMPQFRSSLTRYTLRVEDVHLTFVGPT